MKKNKILFVTIMFILISFFLYGLCFGISDIQTEVFFRKLSDYFADSFNNVFYSWYNNPYSIGINEFYPQEHTYPPLAYMIFKIMVEVTKHFSSNNGLFFVCHFSVMLFCFVLLLTLYNGIKTGNIFRNLLIFIFIFSGIFIYSYERGNIAILCAAFSTFYIFNYKSENKLIKELSLISLAIAVALKITPALLILLLLYNKEYEAVIRTIIYSLILFFVPFMFFKGGFSAIPVLLNNMQLNVQNYHWRGTPNFLIVPNSGIQTILKLCFAKIATLFSILALVSNFTFKTEWKKVAQLTLIIQNITSSSAIYVMLNFFAFVVLFFNKTEKANNDIFYIILMIIILNPYQIGFGMSFDFVLLSQLFLLVILTQESLKNLFSILKKKFVLKNKDSNNSNKLSDCNIKS